MGSQYHRKPDIVQFTAKQCQTPAKGPWNIWQWKPYVSWQPTKWAFSVLTLRVMVLPKTRRRPTHSKAAKTEADVRASKGPQLPQPNIIEILILSTRELVLMAFKDLQVPIQTNVLFSRSPCHCFSHVSCPHYQHYFWVDTELFGMSITKMLTLISQVPY